MDKDYYESSGLASIPKGADISGVKIDGEPVKLTSDLVAIPEELRKSWASTGKISVVDTETAIADSRDISHIINSEIVKDNLCIEESKFIGEVFEEVKSKFLPEDLDDIQDFLVRAFKAGSKALKEILLNQ